jgi:ABC-type polysaccharide/polyol phosphate transport system ATPase subunit
MEHMTGSGSAITFDHVVKEFRLFTSSIHRVKEALHPGRKTHHTALPVLREVSFSIPEGQTVAILGPNGVGKSTILHLVAGILRPSQGRVTVNGRVSAIFDLGESFSPELTGRENVRLFHDLILEGAGNSVERERLIQKFADIGDYFDRPVRTYSTGMFMRLAFANALAAEPDILLIDEVLAVGDARFQQKCFGRIRELKAQGTTILLVTHAVETIPGLCDRALLFDRGQLVFDGSAAAGVDRYYQLFFNVPEQPLLDPSLEQFRYGAGGARIVSSFASRDGASPQLTFQRGERIKIVMDVEFERDVENPHFGFSCSTKEGIRLYATTTTLLGKNPVRAFAGELRRVELTFELSLAVADVFIDLTVFDQNPAAVSILDVRLGILHLTISSVQYCGGIVDLDLKFSESELRAGNRHERLTAVHGGNRLNVSNTAVTSSNSTGGAA